MRVYSGQLRAPKTRATRGPSSWNSISRSVVVYPTALGFGFRVCSFFRNGGAPLIAHLCQHVVPPNHPNYSQLGFRVHPPKLGLIAVVAPGQGRAKAGSSGQGSAVQGRVGQGQFRGRAGQGRASRNCVFLRRCVPCGLRLGYLKSLGLSPEDVLGSPEAFFLLFGFIKGPQIKRAKGY